MGSRRIAPRLRVLRLAGALLVAIAALGAACSRTPVPSPEPTPAPSTSLSALVTVPSATAPGAPRPGMLWIPSGILRAGTPEGRYPRIADEDLPGTEMALGGFYIDELPFPNEPGAIPTTNVTRDEAAHVCEVKGKRLCTELEWERACKGPDNAMYEYGDTYRSSTCGTGVVLEQAARRPSGERNACKSGFGVREMHGGVLEWTDSLWERGGTTKLGVLKGGSAVAGEIAGRCSNAMARPTTSKSPAMGLRCCAGPRNDARVELAVKGGGPLDPIYVPKADPHWGPVEWVWRPARNEEIHLRGECHDDAAGSLKCVCRVLRTPREGAESDDAGAGRRGEPQELARVETGKALCGILQPTRDPRDLRMIYMDKLGRSRTVRYSYGRVDVGEPR